VQASPRLQLQLQRWKRCPRQPRAELGRETVKFYFYGACCEWRRTGCTYSRFGSLQTDMTRHDTHAKEARRRQVALRCMAMAWGSSLVNKDGNNNKARQARWMRLPPATPVASRHALACCSWALPAPNSVDWSVQPQPRGPESDASGLREGRGKRLFAWLVRIVIIGL